nr:SPOR domain-containing protein [Iningainema tapete]
MLSAIPNQLIAFTHLSRAYWITSLLLGGWLALIPHLTTQAQIKSDGVLQAQVIDFVPPPPSNNEPLPPLPVDRDGYRVPPVNTNPQRYYQNRAGYKVFINSSSYQLLQQVRNQVDRGAFRTSYQGRSVIQAGAFSTRASANRRLEQLRSIGIYNLSSTYTNNGQGRPNLPDQGDYSRRSRNYYVVIPALGEDLFALRNQINRNVGQNNIEVVAREQPRGPHVAVGPFYQRSLAEQWNKYLRDQGYRGARVYYGK